MTISAAPRRLYYHGWNIVAVAILSCVAANGLAVNAFGLFLPTWSADLNTPISTLQLGLASLGFLSAFLSPTVGILTDKYPARSIMVAGLVGLAIFHLGISFVTETWQYLALFAAVLPISLCMATNIPANAAIAKWFVKSRGLALGLASFGLGAAGVILPPIIAALEPTLGWRTLWRIAGLIIVIVIIPAVLFVIRDRPSEHDGTDYLAGESNAISHHGGASTDDKTSWRDVFGRRNFWLLVFAYVPMLGLYGASANNVATITQDQGFNPQTAGLMLSAMHLAQLVGSLSVGMLSDRFGNRLPLFGLAVLAGLGGFIIAFGHGFNALMTGMTLVGFGAAFWPVLSGAIAAEFGPGAFGRAFGLAALFVPLISLAPFMVAKIHELTGGYASGIAAIAALALIGGAGALFIREKKPAAD